MSKQKLKHKTNNFCSLNNLLSYFGLTNARMRASEKDLPVLFFNDKHNFNRNDDHPTVLEMNGL